MSVKVATWSYVKFTNRSFMSGGGAGEKTITGKAYGVGEYEKLDNLAV